MANGNFNHRVNNGSVCQKTIDYERGKVGVVVGWFDLEDIV